mmetsp:Transcript_94042/g.275243  ORF Transcript_94042/g.275243 Transcript_94042/m.275243 type:complete len:164 (-) Transcript_94042:137-628(-)
MTVAWRPSLHEAWKTAGITTLQPPEATGIDGPCVIVSVCGIRCGSHVLAFRRPCGGYTMPGGKLEEEDGGILACASRETEEECGIALPPASWDVIATSVLQTAAKTYVLVLCSVELEEYPSKFDAESLGMEALDLFSDFPALGGNGPLFEAMRAQCHAVDGGA